MSHLWGSAPASTSCCAVPDFATFCCHMRRRFVVFDSFIGGCSWLELVVHIGSSRSVGWGWEPGGGGGLQGELYCVGLYDLGGIVSTGYEHFTVESTANECVLLCHTASG